MTTKRLVKRFSLFLLSTAVTVVFMELVLRGVFRDSMDLDMEMWKHAVSLEVLRPDSACGHAYRTNTSRRLMGQTITINNIGIRSPVDYPPRETGDRPALEIVFIGDYTTLGWGLSDSATIPHQVETRVRDILSKPVHALNLGVGNYNSIQEYCRFREFYPMLRPDAVVLLHFINDAETYQSVPRIRWYHRSYLWAFTRSRLRRLSEGAESYTSYYNRIYREPAWQENQMKLLAMKAFLEEAGIPFFVFGMPELRDVTPPFALAPAYESRRNFFVRHGFNYIDFLSVLQGEAPDSLWVHPGDSHPGPKAAALMAEEVTRAIDWGALWPRRRASASEVEASDGDD